MHLSPRLVIGLIVIAGLAACAGHKPGGKVIVDMKGVDREQYQKDFDECSAYTSQVDGQGKVVGGAAGAAVVGGAKGVGETANERHAVVSNCLRNRGYAVLN